jgi:hypothetical protein
MKNLLLFIVILFIVPDSSHTFAQSENNLNDLVLVEGNYLRNLGSFGEVWSEAAGGYIGYGIFFPEHNLLMFRTGYMNHKLRSEGQSEGSLSVLPIQIGGRYYFTNDWVMPFFQFMNGFNIIFENMNLSGVKEDRTLLKYFWQVGVGGTFSLSEIINIDIGLNYNSAFYDNNKELYGEAGAMMTGFEYTIGFGWKFNN